MSAPSNQCCYAAFSPRPLASIKSLFKQLRSNSDFLYPQKSVAGRSTLLPANSRIANLVPFNKPENPALSKGIEDLPPTRATIASFYAQVCGTFRRLKPALHEMLLQISLSSGWDGRVLICRRDGAEANFVYEKDMWFISLVWRNALQTSRRRDELPHQAFQALRTSALHPGQFANFFRISIR